MKTTKTRMALSAALLCGLGSPGLRAQEDGPCSVSFKIRGGLMAGDLRDAHYDNKVMGFGAEVRRDSLFGLGGALSAELTWEYVPSRHRDAIDWSSPGLDIHPSWSFSDRRESGQGWNLRAAYWGKLPAAFPSQALNSIARDTEWFVGVGIDMYKVRSDFRWAIRDQAGHVPTPTDMGNPGFYLGGYGSSNIEETAFCPGIFAGLKYRISGDFGLEVALRNFGMKTHAWTPGAFLGKDDGIMEGGTSRGTSMEFALTMRL